MAEQLSTASERGSVETWKVLHELGFGAERNAAGEAYMHIPPAAASLQLVAFVYSVGPISTTPSSAACTLAGRTKEIECAAHASMNMAGTSSVVTARTF